MMGYQLASLAIVQRHHYGREVTNTTWLVLVCMCLMSLDHDDTKRGIPAALYFGGWAPLAMALGYDVPDPKDLPPAAHRAVARAFSELTQARVIAPVIPAPAIAGTSRAYTIRLWHG